MRTEQAEAGCPPIQQQLRCVLPLQNQHDYKKMEKTNGCAVHRYGQILSESTISPTANVQIGQRPEDGLLEPTQTPASMMQLLPFYISLVI